MKTVEAKVVEAKAITVNLGDDLQKYKDSFLKIFNNARESASIFYKVRNFYGSNNIEVIANHNYADKIKDWLECYGEIVYVEDTEILAVECDGYYPAIVDIDYIEE